MKIKVIPPLVFKSLINDKVPITRTYFDRNSLVRQLYWYRLQMLVNCCDCTHHSKVLDFGSGQGVLLPTLSVAFTEVYAFDLIAATAKNIVDFYKLYNVKIIQGDGYVLPFRSESFDAVFAASVFEHIKDLTSLLHEIVRVLKPGGQLLLASPSENLVYRIGRLIFRYKKPKDHFHRFDNLVPYLKKHFVIMKIIQGPISFPPFLAVYKIIKAQKSI